MGENQTPFYLIENLAKYLRRKYWKCSETLLRTTLCRVMFLTNETHFQINGTLDETVFYLVSISIFFKCSIADRA